MLVKMTGVLVAVLCLSGCSFTEFNADADQAVFVVNYSHSERFVDSENPMGRITTDKIENGSDIARIQTSDENVIWVPRIYASTNAPTVTVKPDEGRGQPESSERMGQCSARNGKACKPFKAFQLFDELLDVPDEPSGEIMTCRVGQDSTIYSCEEGVADCVVGKLGEYCLRAQ